MCSKKNSDVKITFIYIYKLCLHFHKFIFVWLCVWHSSSFNFQSSFVKLLVVVVKKEFNKEKQYEWKRFF